MSPFDRRLATGLVGTLALAIACDDARAAEPSVPRDPQESDPNVGLFRLPAHRGEADALAGPEGFGFLSKDNKFGMMVHWVLPADVRGELGTLEPGEDRTTFLVPFAGLALTTRFYERIRSELLVSFSQSQLLLSQAWLDAEIEPWLHLKAGQFPFAISLERSTASIFFPLVNADMPSSLLPGNDTGVEVWGRVDGVLEYSVALVNGATAGSVAYGDVDSNKDVVGRVVTSPVEARGPDVLRGLSFGVGGGAGAHHGTSTNPELPILATWGGVK